MLQDDVPFEAYSGAFSDGLASGTDWYAPRATLSFGRGADIQFLDTPRSAKMTEAIADRVRRYVLDGSDADLRRLLGISQVTAEAARGGSLGSASGKGGGRSTAGAARSGRSLSWQTWSAQPGGPWELTSVRRQCSGRGP